jgi:hypothetical protein
MSWELNKSPRKDEMTQKMKTGSMGKARSQFKSPNFKNIGVLE